MKKAIICIFSIIVIIWGVILGITFYNKSNIVAQVNINIPSFIESSTHYTYYIYKKSSSEYTYQKVETQKWINEITSKKIVDSGSIKNKEQLNIIQKDIEENTWDYPIKFSNIVIYYKNEKLNTLEELAEKLF